MSVALTPRWRPSVHWCAAHQANPRAWPKALKLRVAGGRAVVHLNGDGLQVRWSWQWGMAPAEGDLSVGISVRPDGPPLWPGDQRPTLAEAMSTAQRECEQGLAAAILADGPELFSWCYVGINGGNARDRRRSSRAMARLTLAWARSVRS